MLLVINLAFSMYYVSHRPHMGGRKKLYNESHNEAVIIILCYHMFLFDNFIPKTDINTIFIMGYSFVFWIGEILFVNIFILFFDILNEQKNKRAKAKKQEAYEKIFKEFQKMQTNLYLKKAVEQ